MKRLFHLALAMALAACTAVENPVQVPAPQAPDAEELLVFTATCGNPDSRTQRDEEGKMYWSPGDKIHLWLAYNSSNVLSTDITSPARTVTFAGTSGQTSGSFNDFVALYPYAKSGNGCSYNSSEDYYEIKTYTYSQQKAVEGSFDTNLFVSVARSKTKDLHFQNACGGVKFSVSTSGIRKATLTSGSRNLAGYMSIKLWEDHIESSAYWNDPDNLWLSDNEVFLYIPNGGSFAPGSSYYFVTVPVMLEDGFTIRFYTDTHYAERVISQPVEIKRGHCVVVNNADAGLEWKAINGDLENTTDTPIE